ncbi:unnamed protein product [Linum trigynum]|uniref:PHD-type domain-containing protein n=1 Tax=Linum trigynum TaxID=586398 RepID=A0AAV2C983_9ROSI
MVLQRSVEGPVSCSLNRKNDDVAWEWIPESESWKPCSQPEDGPEDDNADPSSHCSSFLFSGSNVQYKRRRIRRNSLILFTEAACEDEVELDSDSQQEKSASGSSSKRVQGSVIGAEIGKDDLRLLGESGGPELRSRECDREHISCGTSLTRTTSDVKCWISDPEESEQDLQIKEICISVLKNHGIPLGNGPKSKPAFDPASENTYQSCEACGVLESIVNMIICDDCEEAFHLSCSGTNRKTLEDADEWYCKSCLKLKGKDAKGPLHVKSRGMKGWSLGPNQKLGRIARMLKYPDSHVSLVRIGDPFQATVPEWRGKNTEGFDCIGEPIEMDPLETLGLQGCAKDNILKPSSMSNWLQCREVLDDQPKERGYKRLCGKWRRAPLSAVQSDDWECSCALPWDPFHADCNVPQELETEKVLVQLKYIEQLKCRLAAKKRK